MQNAFFRLMALFILCALPLFGGIGFAAAQSAAPEAATKPAATSAAKAQPGKAANAAAPAKWAKEIKLVETYLNNLTTGRARFVQTTHDGTQLVGTFFIERPGKLRFEYDAPIEDFVVADGFFIYFYDAELGEQTNAPIGQTLADFFLRKDIHLRDDLKVVDVKRGGGYLQMKLIQSADPDAGSLTLGFGEDPFTLKKWRIVDGQGLITEVELFYLKTGISHPNGVFVYADPKKGAPRFNR